MVDIPDEITRVETEIKAYPLTNDERTALKWIGRIIGGIVLVVALALAVNWGLSHFGGQDRYDEKSFFGR